MDTNKFLEELINGTKVGGSVMLIEQLKPLALTQDIEDLIVKMFETGFDSAIELLKTNADITLKQSVIDDIKKKIDAVMNEHDNVLLKTAVRFILNDEDFNETDKALLKELNSIDINSEDVDKRLVHAIKIIRKDFDPICGTYALFYSRDLFLDTNHDRNKILEMLKNNELDIVCIPEYPNDNHIGLKLQYI